MSTPEATERKVIGTCSGLEEGKNGWYTVKIAVPGKQYPVKAQTKIEHLLNEARRVRDGGVVATWTIKDQKQVNQDGTPKINPNSGQQYENHYLQNVEEGAQQAPAGQAQIPTAGGNQSEAPAPQPEPHHTPIHFADKDRVISRLSCLSTAANLLNGTTELREMADPGLEVMKLASRFEQWTYRDIDPLPSSEAPKPQAVPAASPEPSPEPQDQYEPDIPPDDDIPF